MAGDAKYWVGICYPENMIHDWQDKISDILQVPYAYCIHDSDHNIDGEDRKTHVHIVICWNNTTTYKAALSAFDSLSEYGKKCCNKCEKVRDMRYIYNYLIHNTESSKKAGKHLYLPEERIEGNNFDIGLFEQVSIADKERMREELADFVCNNHIFNLKQLRVEVKIHFDSTYLNILASYQGYLSNLCKGNYQELRLQKEIDEYDRYSKIQDSHFAQRDHD